MALSPGDNIPDVHTIVDNSLRAVFKQSQSETVEIKTGGQVKIFSRLNYFNFFTL